MTVIVFEKKGRQDSWGKARRGKRKFGAIGSQDESEVRAAVISYAPPFLNGNIIDTVDLDEVYPNIWDVDVNWISPELKDQQDQQNPDTKEVGDFSFNFEITAGTQKITRAYDHRIYARAGVTPPPPTFLIANGEGVEVPVPEYSWGEEHTINITALTDDYIAKLRKLFAKTNHSTFRGLDPNTVQFMGVTGRPGKTADKVTLSFKFRAGDDSTEEIDGIEIEKGAWEYVWIQAKKDQSGNHVIPVIDFIHVYEVFLDGNFGDLGIGEDPLNLTGTGG